eukprot:GILJ01008076.1.p1 GENE.GILJ01008076.1~~GILJ01008076.1.p1  ORF type:complete len:487 (+),score=68.38 GILJ01008076.1:151-1461(+)
MSTGGPTAFSAISSALNEARKSLTPAKPRESDSLEFIPVSKLNVAADDDDVTLLSDSSVRPPWRTEKSRLDGSMSPVLILHEEILEFCNFVAPTSSEHKMRLEVVDRLRDIIVGLWPAAQVETFGSFASKLYLPLGDVDIVILNGPEKIPKALQKLASILVQRRLVKSIETIAKARVPIIKLVDAETGIPVDISFNVQNGVDANALVRDYMESYPEMRHLTIVLKYFLYQRGLNETFRGGMGSFLLQSIIISFLQHHPSRNQDRNNFNSYSLGHYLLDFLELYGRNFNYTDVGISIRGKGSYFPKSRRDWYDRERPFLLAVENPQDPELDIGKNSWAVRSIKKAFEHAYGQITSSAKGFWSESLNSSGSVSMDSISILNKMIRPDAILHERKIKLQQEKSAGSSRRKRKRSQVAVTAVTPMAESSKRLRITAQRSV